MVYWNFGLLKTDDGDHWIYLFRSGKRKPIKNEPFPKVALQNNIRHWLRDRS